MPENFLACVSDGGRVRTKDLGGGKFMRICFDKSGKSHAGEVMMKKDHESINAEDFEIKEFEPPESGDAPQGVKDILANAYSSCRRDQVAKGITDKERCSKIAWGAVHNAGWSKDASGNWHKSGGEMKNLNLVCQIKESKIEETKRTVVAGVLEEDVLSANNRFYPQEVVRKAIASLPGKRSMIGHDTEDVRDVVAVIEGAEMRGRLGVAAFRFGTDGISESVFRKIKEGLVDSVSIRATGTTKRAKLNNSSEEFYDVVEEMEIHSVDWVTMPGISSAKVMKVFEQSPQYSFEDNLKEELSMNEKEIQDLKARQEELEKQNKALLEVQKEKEKQLEEAKKKQSEAEIETHKEKRLAEVKDDKARELVKKQLNGKTIQEIDAQFKDITDWLEESRKITGKREPIIHPVDGKNIHEKEGKFVNVNDLLESDKVKQEDKQEVLTMLLGGQIRTKNR